MDTGAGHPTAEGLIAEGPIVEDLTAGDQIAEGQIVDLDAEALAERQTAKQLYATDSVTFFASVRCIDIKCSEINGGMHRC
jgi:hypothetical protein